MSFIAPLFDGPLDIVGDIHGEREALAALLTALGYAADGGHPRGRRLVFIGDLCDRGPDSPGVIADVARLVSLGRAQCLLGNHELNVLRAAPKSGNGWFFADDHDAAGGKYAGSRPVHPDQRRRFQAFFATLPVALERADLRLVHAAWQDDAIAALRAPPPGESLLGYYDRHARQSHAAWESDPLARRAIEEWQTWGQSLGDADARVPLLEAMGRSDQHFQMSNPLFGHYWRWVSAAAQRRFSRGERDVFGGAAPNAWLGPRRNAFCLDFAVGIRYAERPLPPGTRSLGRLGAVRWPERELVFDDGERLPLVTPAAA